jgi:hypothetical protein
MHPRGLETGSNFDCLDGRDREESLAEVAIEVVKYRFS